MSRKPPDDRCSTSRIAGSTPEGRHDMGQSPLGWTLFGWASTGRDARCRSCRSRRGRTVVRHARRQAGTDQPRRDQPLRDLPAAPDGRRSHRSPRRGEPDPRHRAGRGRAWTACPPSAGSRRSASATWWATSPPATARSSAARRRPRSSPASTPLSPSSRPRRPVPGPRCTSCDPRRTGWPRAGCAATNECSSSQASGRRPRARRRNPWSPRPLSRSRAARACTSPSARSRPASRVRRRPDRRRARAGPAPVRPRLPDRVRPPAGLAAPGRARADSRRVRRRAVAVRDARGGQELRQPGRHDGYQGEAAGKADRAAKVVAALARHGGDKRAAADRARDEAQRALDGPQVRGPPADGRGDGVSVVVTEDPGTGGPLHVTFRVDAIGSTDAATRRRPRRAPAA
jgi:hypothetical protein